MSRKYKRRVRKRFKKRVLKFFSTIFFVLSIGFFAVFAYYYFYPAEMVVGDLTYEDGLVTIAVDNAGKDSYCAIVSSKVEKADISDDDWKKISSDKCLYELDKKGNYSVYIKHDDQIEQFTFNEFFEISVSQTEFYLALNDSEKLKYKSLSFGDSLVEVESLDSDVIKIKNDVMTAVGEGTTKVVISGGNIKEEIDVVVTDLIDPMPKEYNYNRKQ